MAEEFQSLTIKFGANTVEFERNVKGMGKALTYLRKDITNLNRQLKLDPGNVDLLKQKYENFANQIEVNKDKIAKLKKEQADLGKEKVGSAEWQKLQLEIDKTEGQLKTVEAAANRTEKEIKEAADPKSVTNLNRALDETQKDLDIVNQKLKLDPGNVKLAEERMRLLEQQSSLADDKVDTLQKNLKELQATDAPDGEIKKLSQELGYAEIEAKEAKNAVQGVGDESVKAGEKGRSGTGITKLGLLAVAAAAKGAQLAIGMIKNSISNAVSRIDTLNSFPKIMKNLGFSADESKKSINRLSEGIDGLPTALNEVAATTKSLAPFTKSLGEATELTLGLNNAFIASGSDSADAARGLQQYSQMLAVGKVDAQAWKTITETMGSSLQQVAKKMLGTKASTQDLYDALKSGKLSFDDLNASVIEMSEKGGAGFASFSSQALDASQGIATGWSVIKTAITAGVANSIDKIDLLLKEQGFGGISGVLGEVKASVKAAFVSFNGVLDTVLPKIINMAKWVKDNSTAIKAMVIAVTSAAVGWKLLNTAMNAIKWMKVVQQLALATTGTTALTTATNAQAVAAKAAGVANKVFNAVLKANPIILVISLIAALVAALIYFFTQTEKGRKIFQKFKDTIAGAIEVIKTKFGEFKESAVKKFNEVVTFVKSIPQKIANFFMGLPQKIITAIGNIAAVYLFIWNTIINKVKTIGSAIANFFKGLPGKIKTAIGNIGAVYTFIWNGIVNKISGIGAKIAGFFSGLPGKIKGKIGDMKSVGKSIIDSLIAGLGNIGDALIKAVKGGIKKAKSGIGNVLSGIFGGGKSLGLNINGVGGVGAVGSIFNVKMAGVMPEVASASASTNVTNLNISVDANNVNGMEIAREVERVIVRRLNI